MDQRTIRSLKAHYWEKKFFRKLIRAFDKNVSLPKYLMLWTCLFWLRWLLSLYVIMSRTPFRINLHSIVAWMSRKSKLKIGATSKGNIQATFDIQANIDCRFTLKRVHDMTNIQQGLNYPFAIRSLQSVLAVWMNFCNFSKLLKSDTSWISRVIYWTSYIISYFKPIK